MQMVAPAGPMYQAGTLSGNPLAMTAGIKTLEILSRPGERGVPGSEPSCWVDGWLAGWMAQRTDGWAGQPWGLGSQWRGFR